MIQHRVQHPGPDGSRPGAAGRLKDIEALTDAALSRLDGQSLLNAVLGRVKEILDADTASVMLIDQATGQLVAAAANGIQEEACWGTRIPLGTGFAGRIAASRKPLILNQVSPDMVSNLLVDRGTKSLLGVPLLAGGRVVGVLQVGSLSGKPFTPQDAELLQLAADRAALALQSMMAQDDRLAAAALYRSLRPPLLPRIPGVELAARYVAGSGYVGGDWYDVFALPGGNLGLVIGDVAGSGLAAAVIMGRIRSTLRSYVLQTDDPATALRLLDRKIQYFEADAMATVQYSVYEPAIGRLVISSAGHLPPVLVVPGTEPRIIETELDVPIGVADEPHRHSTVVDIAPGSLVCYYTDGLVERRGQDPDTGIGLLARAIGEGVAVPRRAESAPIPEVACTAAMQALLGQAPARDDVALVILHRSP